MDAAQGELYMEQSKAIRLSKLVETIDGQIAQLQTEGLPHTALLLEMARLDLQTRLHDISEQELKELCLAIEQEELPSRTRLRSHARVPVGDAGTSLNRSGRHNARQGLRVANGNSRILSKDNQHA
jgi:hypothetical protein